MGETYGVYWALYGQNGSGPKPGCAWTTVVKAGATTRHAAQSQGPSPNPRRDVIFGLPDDPPPEFAPTGSCLGPVAADRTTQVPRPRPVSSQSDPASSRLSLAHRCSLGQGGERRRRSSRSLSWDFRKSATDLSRL